MAYRDRRPGRRLVLPLLLFVLLVAVIVLAVGAPSAATQLVLRVRGDDGRFGATVRPPAPEPGRSRRHAPYLPLALSVSNEGSRPLQPGRLELLVPSRYRLVDRNGTLARAATVEPGEPLLRYVLPLNGLRLPPGGRARIAAGDSLWLVPATPPIRCVLASDSVPIFEPTPRVSAALLTPVRIFYAFRGGKLKRRAAGLITLSVDSTLVAPPGPERVREDRATVQRPAVAWPDVAGLTRVGYGPTYCGPMDAPYRMVTTLWRTAAGGRVFGLSVDGRAREYVYDLNGDSVAELEIWDSDGDGRFEAERRVDFPLPAFLFPPGSGAARPDSGIVERTDTTRTR